MNRLPLTLLGCLLFLYSSCREPFSIDGQSTDRRKDTRKAVISRPSLKDITGISYTEVRRSFDDGVSFHYTGFQLEPEWKLTFTSDSTVKIFSPTKQDYIHYPMYYSHATVFNFAREWLRIVKLSKDSLVFELLEVENKVVLKKPQKVFMTFYADDHINNTLRTTVRELRRPNRKDSLYIKARAAKANSDIKKAFPARNPVVMKSTSAALKVEKVEANEDLIRNVETMDSYLLPKHNITIHRAYRDFGYYFSVIIDSQGKIHFNRFLQTVDPEFLDSKTKVVQGIIDVYLENMMKVTPGNTLDYTHPSIVTLYVSGKKGQKNMAVR